MVGATSKMPDRASDRRSAYFFAIVVIVPCLIFGGLFVRHQLACREALAEVRRLGGRVPGVKSGSMFGIEEVDLSGSSVSDDDLSGLVARLLPTNGPVTLNLSRTAITDAGLAHLKPLTRLARLDLSATRVTGPGLAVLARFGELSDRSAQLSLARTPISDDSLAHLKGWRWLQDLDLSATRITDRGLALLGGMGPMLSRVDLGGTDVTDEGVERLRRAYPGASIGR